jgi:hypothetical protein
MEKVYPYQKKNVLGFVLMGIFCLFVFLLFLAGKAAMGPAPPFETMVMNFFVVILPICAIISFLCPFVMYPYFVIREIVIGENGVSLKRGSRPIIIQKITDLKTRKFRGKDVNITITGLTPDGRKVRKRLARKGGGDVDKRWEEFKSDLQKLKLSKKK